jgi:uncharacterized protein YbjT (DUF2867 family)
VILVTGASGTIGSRLADRLASEGRPVRLGGRRPWELERRFPDREVVEVDVLRSGTLAPALEGVHAAYYLVHSMEPAAEGAFTEREAQAARLFAQAASEAGVERILYLGGLGSDDDGLSHHLASRQATGRLLAGSGPRLLEFRAAMVVSADSASFRMLMDFVRRLPAMVVPRWVETPSQPIAIEDVVSYLVAGLDVPLEHPHTIVEIGGPDVLSYREMLEIAAAREGRTPVILQVPFLTPKLSSYWAGLTTSVPVALARPLIEGLAVPLLVRSDAARTMFPKIRPMSFEEALDRAFAGA